MSTAAESKLCVLWESELRATGKALAAVFAEEISEDEKGERLRTFLEAAWAALYHLAQPDADSYAAIVVGAIPPPRRNGKKAKVTA